MFEQLSNLFNADKVEKHLLTIFDSLLNNYSFSYSKEELGNSVDKNGDFVFFGPLNAYQFYNQNICINILHLMQRDDYDVYITDKRSADQVYIRNGVKVPSHLNLLVNEIEYAIVNDQMWYDHKI